MAGISRQEGEKWPVLPGPPGDLLVELAAHPAGIIGASFHRCWLHAGGSWRIVFETETILKIVGTGREVLVLTPSAIWRVDAAGRPEIVRTHAEPEGKFDLARIGGRIYFLGFHSGLILEWGDEGFVRRSEPLEPELADLQRRCWIREDQVGNGFYLVDGQPGPRALLDEATIRAFGGPHPTWPQLLRELPPNAAVARLGPLWFFPSREGLQVWAGPEGRRVWTVTGDNPDDAVQNLQPTGDGILATGKKSLYFLPDPSDVQFAPIPGLLHGIATTAAGTVLLTSRGQFTPDGRDLRIRPYPVLGLRGFRAGGMAIATPGEVDWDGRRYAIEAIKSDPVMMEEIAPDRLGLVLPGAVFLLDRSGELHRIEPPQHPIYVAGLRREPGYLVFTVNGIFRYDPAGRLRGSFGRGLCTPSVIEDVVYGLDERGEFYDESGRSLGRLPLTRLASAVAWQGQLYVMGRMADGSVQVARADPATGAWEPLDLPLTSTPVELRLVDGGLALVCEAEVIKILRPRPVAKPDVRAEFRLPDGQPLPADGLRADQGNIVLTLPARRPDPWRSPGYHLKINDEGWEPVEAGAVLPLRRLGAGANTLLLRGRMAGLENVARYEVRRARPWWQRWPGFALYAAGTGLLVFGAVRWRTRSLRRRTDELERIIATRTEELARANRVKTEFIASMNHEIRNPLNGVVGIARLLRETDLDSRGRVLTDSLVSCAEQLRATMDDVLDFSAIDRGQMREMPEDFDLVQLVKDACHYHDRDEAPVALTGNPPAVCWSRGDQGKIRLVLSNYLSNAQKYGDPPGARVELAVQPVGEGAWRFRLSVHSCGTPLADEELAGLFQPFVRGTRARATGAQGFGLGLAICQRYAAALRGAVGAERDDAGTVFWLSGPLARIEPPANPTSHTPLPTGLRVLAVEDEKYNRIVLAHHLRALRCEVDWAVNGDEALALARRNRYHLILSDWSVPGLSGAALLQRFAEAGGVDRPPIIVISAYATTERQAEALAAGATAFVSKPISVGKLHDALRIAAGRLLVGVPPTAEAAPATELMPLLAIGRPELLEEFVRDIDESFARAQAAEDPATAAAEVHRLRSLALLARADSLTAWLRQLESALRENRATEERTRLWREVAREIKSATAGVADQIRH